MIAKKSILYLELTEVVNLQFPNFFASIMGFLTRDFLIHLYNGIIRPKKVLLYMIETSDEAILAKIELSPAFSH